jgi:hypothetical protein
MNRTDDGHGAILYGEKSLTDAPHSLGAVFGSHRRKFIEVITRAEMRSLARKNYGSHTRADLIRIGEHSGDLDVHIAIDRIDRWPGEADYRDSRIPTFGGKEFKAAHGTKCIRFRIWARNGGINPTLSRGEQGDFDARNTAT